MLQTIEGIYHNGQIKLLETPKEIGRARVIVTFLSEEMPSDERESLVGTIEILDDDWETPVREFRDKFWAAAEKSGDELSK